MEWNYFLNFSLPQGKPWMQELQTPMAASPLFFLSLILSLLNTKTNPNLNWFPIRPIDRFSVTLPLAVTLVIRSKPKKINEAEQLF